MHKKPFHIPCQHFELCSGCVIQDQPQLPPVFFEMQKFFQGKGRSDFTLKFGKMTQWRTRAKLSVRGSSSNPLIGLYKKKSHEVISIPHCAIHHPSINLAVSLIQDFIIANAITPYQEKTYQGILRYLQLTVDPQTHQVQVVFVINEPALYPSLQEKLLALWQKKPDLWHSFWVNFNTSRTNEIMSSQWKHLEGAPWLWITLMGRKVCFHPASFIQAHLQCFEYLLEDLSQLIPKKSKVLEFFAGTGVIGLALINFCQSVICSEIVPFGKTSFDLSYELLTEEEKNKISYLVGDAKDLLKLLETSETVFVDPPRKGLEPVFIEALDQSSCQQFIYMSCGWRSFQRDCQVLLQKGWSLKWAKGYLFFPGSDHVELLTIFER